MDKIDSDWLSIYVYNLKTRETLLRKIPSGIYKDKNQFINQIMEVLEKYDINKHNPLSEDSLVKNFGALIDNGREWLKEIGFKILHNNDSVRNNDFWIHLTRKKNETTVLQFLIRELKKLVLEKNQAKLQLKTIFKVEFNLSSLIGLKI